MNFEQLKNSVFYKMGYLRVCTVDCTNSEDDPSSWIKNIKLAPIASYDVMEVNTDNEILKRGIAEPRTLISMKHMNIVNLGQALCSGNDYIPKEFRDVIYHQWREMNSIFHRLGAQPKLVKFFIQAPGTNPGMHTHRVKQTLTFAYFYEEDKVSSSRGSYFMIRAHDGGEYQVSIPENQPKIYFNFPNGQWHDIWSHRWAFYWVADFNDDIVIPDDVDFSYLNLRESSIKI